MLCHNIATTALSTFFVLMNQVASVIMCYTLVFIISFLCFLLFYFFLSVIYFSIKCENKTKDKNDFAVNVEMHSQMEKKKAV